MFDKIRGEATAAAATLALDKAQEVLKEFNDTIPVMNALGLSVSNFSFKMGIPPEIGARLTGTVEALDPGKIKELIQTHQENKAITAILEALRTAANFKDQLNKVGFSGIKIDVKLGILPNVEVGLLTKTDSAGARLSPN